MPVLATAPKPPDELLQAARTWPTTWLASENGRVFRANDGAAVPIAVTVPAIGGLCAV